MKRYNVVFESISIERVVVEAEDENDATEKALDIDDREIVDGSVEVVEVTEIEDNDEETNDSGSGERTEDEGDVH